MTLLAIAFGYLWGVLQLIVAGSFARTVRVITVLAAVATGFYLCAPLALLVERLVTRAVAAATGTPLFEMATTMGYRADPLIEEVAKLAPLLILTRMRKLRAQWSITDYVLVTAAAGSGFGLAEQFYRYNDAGETAAAIVQSFATVITSWLPDGVAPATFIPGVLGAGPPNLHLIWSAITGFAVGLVSTVRRPAVTAAAAVLFFYAVADHAAFNAIAFGSDPTTYAIAQQFGAFRGLIGLFPLLALVVAYWLDRRRRKAAEPVFELSAARVAGTVASRFPRSLVLVEKLVCLRREYIGARANGTRNAARVGALVDKLRQRVDRLAVGRRVRPSSQRTARLRDPRLGLWLLLAVPSLVWLAAGSMPAAAAWQNWLRTGAPASALIVLSTGGLAWCAWGTIGGLRAWRRTAERNVADAIARNFLAIGRGIGAVSLGLFSLSKALAQGSLNPTLLDGFDVQSIGTSVGVLEGMVLASSSVWVTPPAAGAATKTPATGAKAGPRADKSAYAGEADDPGFLDDDSVYAGEADDPDFVDGRDAAEDRELTAEDLAEWAADADAREAQDAADAAKEKAYADQARAMQLDNELAAAFERSEAAHKEYRELVATPEGSAVTGAVSIDRDLGGDRFRNNLPPDKVGMYDRVYGAAERASKAWAEKETLLRQLTAAKAAADASHAAARDAIWNAQRAREAAAAARSAAKKP